MTKATIKGMRRTYSTSGMEAGAQIEAMAAFCQEQSNTE
jgi:hypothetical protein